MVQNSLLWPENEWPNLTEFTYDTSEDRKTPDQKTIRSMLVRETQECGNLLFERSTSLYNLQLATVYLLLLREKTPGLFPTVQELEKALLYWIRILQSKAFSSDILDVRANRDVHKRSQVRRLTPIWDSDMQVMRVGGRLHKSLMTRERKHPIILPIKSRLIEFIVTNAHKATLHGGVQVTLRLIREKYWILHDKSTVR